MIGHRILNVRRFRGKDRRGTEIEECDFCECPIVAKVRFFVDDGENDGFAVEELCGRHLLEVFHREKESLLDLYNYWKVVVN